MRSFTFARLHETLGDDQRTRAQRDRDLILYSGAFRRLAGVTQVASPVNQGLFHTRLTHSLEVAQIARRIAENLLGQNHAKGIRSHVNPDVVEAAALAHDLGHPPFGHIAEAELDKLARSKNEPDGFEGNAQSFRIITRLAAHRNQYAGLNLTRATLNAVLKYPWLRDLTNDTSKEYKKFGAYQVDKESFDFARSRCKEKTKCIEAEILDYADAVAYSIHDLDDFYKLGLLPLERLSSNANEFNRFIANWEKDPVHKPPKYIYRHFPAIKQHLLLFHIYGGYQGTYYQRASIKTFTSFMLGKFIRAFKVRKDRNGSYIASTSLENKSIIEFLTHTVWHYVILDPRLNTQQFGQRAIIRVLFGAYFEAIQNRDFAFIPKSHQDQAEAICSLGNEHAKVRFAVDMVARLTDSQAYDLYWRLTGTSQGSITDSALS